MDEEEKKEFLLLGKRMLELYHKAPQNGSKRKIMVAEDDDGLGNNVMFFQGSHEDGFALQKFLNERKIK